MFFVVTTGRSGSTTIARVLSQAANCVCLHEPAPDLVEEASMYAYGEMSAGYLRALLLSTRQPLRDGKIYGESSQKLSTLIPVLAGAFPEAQFLWLVRDGRDVVASTFARDWYGAPPVATVPAVGHAPRWSWFRLRADLLGDMTTVEWDAMTQFAKNCWLWNRTNDLIETDLANVYSGRWRLVRLETLFDDLDDISAFLGLEPVRIAGNLRYNPASARTRPSPWPHWPPEQKADFERWCAPQMDALYPGWRAPDGAWQPVYTVAEGAPPPRVPWRHRLQLWRRTWRHRLAQMKR